jgi:hypothetical protein
MTKSTPAIIDSIGIYGLFYIFSGVAAFSGAFAAAFMPETKGLSLKEIRKIYDRKCSPEALKFIEALDAQDEFNEIKWQGARGRRRTISITV